MSCYHWLASYPKSGNTWLRLALASLARGGTPPDFTAVERFSPTALDRAAVDEIVDADTADLTPAEADALLPSFFRLEARWLGEPQLRKVHDAWRVTPAGEPLFPADVTAGAIYLVRDPRDIAVSLAHHLSTGLDEAIDFMADHEAMLAKGGTRGHPQLRQRLTTWGRHVRSWLDAPARPLLLRYEDMLADPADALARAATHLGWEVRRGAVDGAVAATRFEVLREAEQRHGFRERARPDLPFFRRGQAGGWLDTLSPAQAARIESDHCAVMTELGYL